METNLSKYKNDLERLIKKGDILYFSLIFDLGLAGDKLKKTFNEKKVELPKFKDEYENWYSESMQVIKQIIPDRIDDFVKLYKNEKRKQTDYSTYTISDYMIGLVSTLGIRTIAEPKSALPKYEQQLNILKSANKRFESSLFDIKQLLQADIFDSELETARELHKNGFLRPVGVVAGVILESHLSQVCTNHGATIRKKNPTIADYNDLLKNNNVVDVPQWRFIQRLGDLRNLCGHKKNREPTEDEVSELIDGVEKITKTLY